MVNWTILVTGGAPSNAARAYFEKHGLPYKIHSGELFEPQQVHNVVPGYDFILIWAAHLEPTPLFTTSIADELDFTKINMAWDSYGRNYPHKTSVRFTRDLMGIPAFPTADRHWLAKDLNVADGYFESASARLKNLPQPQPQPRVAARRYNPSSGKYE
jgi:hypothetical protein